MPISQGSVETRLMVSGVLYYCFARYLLLSMSVKEFWKSVSILAKFEAWVAPRMSAMAVTGHLADTDYVDIKITYRIIIIIYV